MWFLFVLLDTTLVHTPVSEPDSSEQLSNSGIDFSSNIKKVNFVGETKTAVAETVGEGYQQVTAASKKTCVNENKTTGKATSQAGNGNELNESGARHTVSNSAEQTSNCVTVVAGEIKEIRQVLVEETVPAGTLAESVQQSPASPEKTSADDQNSMGEGNGGSETPEHVITLRSMSNNPDLPCHDENVSGRSSEKLTGIIQDNDGCAGKLTNTSDSDPCIEESKNKLSETPFSQELNEVLDTLDEFVEEFQTTRMRNKSDREGDKKENAKKEGKKEGEKEESNKTESEKMEGEKGSDQGVEKEGEKNVSNKKEDVKEGEKKEDEKKEGKKTEGERKVSNNEGEKEGEEKEGGKKESNKKEGVKREGEKKEGEKKEGEKKEDEEKEGEKKEDEKKEGEKKEEEKKEGEKKEDEKKEDEKKEGERKEDEKKEGEKKEDEKKEGEKKEGEKKEYEKKDGEKKEDDKKEGKKNENEKGKKQYSKDEKETQKTVMSTENENKKDDEPSEARRTTRSITNAGGVQVSLSNISNIIELNI